MHRRQLPSHRCDPLSAASFRPFVQPARRLGLRISLTAILGINDLVIVSTIRANTGAITAPGDYSVVDSNSGSATFQHRWVNSHTTAPSFSGGGGGTEVFVYLVRYPSNRAKWAMIDQHGVNTSTSATSVATPVLTTTQANEIVLELFGDDDPTHTITWTPPTGPTNDYKYGGNAFGTIQQMECWERAATAGNTTSRTATVSSAGPNLWAFAISFLTVAPIHFTGSFTTYPFRRGSFAKAGHFQTVSQAMTGKVALATKGSTTIVFDGTHSRFHGSIVNHIVFNPSYPQTGKFYTRPIFRGVLHVLAIFPTLPGLTYPVSKSVVGDAIA